MRAHNENFKLHSSSWLQTVFLMLWLASAGLQTGVAQQSGPTPPAGTEDLSSSEPSNDAKDQVDSRPQHVPDYLAPSANLHTSRQLLGNLSPLHFGQLNVVSLSFMQAHQSNTQSSIDSSVLRSTLSYSIHKSGMNFAVEYTPTVWLSQSVSNFNLTDHNFELASQRKSGRWIFGVADAFYSLPLRSQFAQFGFDSAYSIRNTDPALLAGDTLSNSANFTADRLMGPADRIEFGLGYLYYNVTNAGDTRNVGLRSLIPDSSEHSADGTLSWNHKLGWRSSLDLRYAFSQRYYTRESREVESGISRHHSIMASYSYQSNSAWEFSLGFGPALWRGIAQRNSQTYVADASIKRKFKRSSLLLTVNRSDEFIGIIGDSLSNQATLVSEVDLGRKLAINTGIGYSRQVLDAQATHGWRAWTQASYELGRHYSWFVGCSFFRQTEASLFNSLPFYFVSTGIRWQWNPRQQRRWGR